MRDLNIYIRNESAWFCLFGNGLPTFACVVGHHENDDGEVIVHYRVDYPVKQGRGWRWRYHDNQQPIDGGRFVIKDSGTYTASLNHFRKLFRPDVYNIYGQFTEEAA